MSMSEYELLQAQIVELQIKADAIRATERLKAVETIDLLVDTFAINSNEIHFPQHVKPRHAPFADSAARKRHPTAGKKLPAQYADNQGNTWSGRGIKPKWLVNAISAGVPLESLRVR